MTIKWLSRFVQFENAPYFNFTRFNQTQYRRMASEAVVSEFNPQEEYLFYPSALSRQSSFDKVTTPAKTRPPAAQKTALYDPNVRKQMSRSKRTRPWFLYGISSIQVILLIYSMVLNLQQTGQFIETSPNFNYLIGPSAGVQKKTYKGPYQNGCPLPTLHETRHRLRYNLRLFRLSRRDREQVR